MNNKKLFDVIEGALLDEDKKVPSYLKSDLKECSEELYKITRTTDPEEVQMVMDSCGSFRARLKGATSMDIINIFDDFIKNVK